MISTKTLQWLRIIGVICRKDVGSICYGTICNWAQFKTSWLQNWLIIFSQLGAGAGWPDSGMVSQPALKYANWAHTNQFWSRWISQFRTGLHHNTTLNYHAAENCWEEGIEFSSPLICLNTHEPWQNKGSPLIASGLYASLTYPNCLLCTQFHACALLSENQFMFEYLNLIILCSLCSQIIILVLKVASQLCATCTCCWHSGVYSV